SNLKWLRDEFQADTYIVEAAAGLLKDQLPQAGVHRIAGGRAIDASGANVQVIETPGHSVDSVCYYLEEEGVLFSGDTILGSTPTTISDLGDYLASLDRIRRLDNLSVICPGHGPLIKEPRSYIEDYIHHRQEREDQILSALAAAPELTSWDITERIY